MKRRDAILVRVLRDDWTVFKNIAKKRGMTYIDLFHALIHGIERTEIKK